MTPLEGGSLGILTSPQPNGGRVVVTTGESLTPNTILELHAYPIRWPKKVVETKDSKNKVIEE